MIVFYIHFVIFMFVKSILVTIIIINLSLVPVIIIFLVIRR